uniref:SNW domain-containing protein 1-like n=1 Tax=Phallusia mammillata TaxID=59560 RepID=A0A6F9DSN0_9ASCI|nr:SNW domain-containing protein 1-like [Phallusia mammillata]
MATLSSLLPEPTQVTYDQLDPIQPTSKAVISMRYEPPPYGHRKGFIPRAERDFGDGGAFPEIPVVQFPLGMGKTKKKKEALAVQLDSEGKIRYDAIARQGHSKDRIVHSKFQQLVPKEILDEDDPDLQRPDEDAIREQTESTRQALEKLTNEKITAAMPVKRAEQRAPAQYIRYTPSQQGVAFNSGAKQRVIRMVEMQKDPMEPPKFKTNKKLPQGPPSPPAPVMHSPNRKLSVKEQQDWKVPPCISNWKNAKGHTIPLDKRLAADGRGLQSVHINENFAKLAEALYIADRKAREAVEMRAQVERKVASKEKEAKERQLRQLAEEARNKRAGIKKDDRDDKEVKERDEIRHERHRDRQRERNLARAAPEKRNRLREERDISEKIALGLPNTRTAQEAQFDQRLFNKSRGMDSGFDGGDDEGYNVYDKPWRSETQVGSSIYRPTKDKDKEMYGDDDIDKLIKSNRFVPDKGFKGADPSQSREGPVQFEKDEDLFGLNKFMEQAKQARKRPTEASTSKSSHDKSKRKRE